LRFQKHPSSVDAKFFMIFAPGITLNLLDVEVGLARLEQILGLHRPRLGAIERMFRYATACVEAKIPGWEASLRVDRFGTAQHLLRRREDALLAGWDPR
jgi:hypothetical protein